MDNIFLTGLINLNGEDYQFQFKSGLLTIESKIRVDININDEQNFYGTCLDGFNIMFLECKSRFSISKTEFVVGLLLHSDTQLVDGKFHEIRFQGGTLNEFYNPIDNIIENSGSMDWKKGSGNLTIHPWDTTDIDFVLEYDGMNCPSKIGLNRIEPINSTNLNKLYTYFKMKFPDGVEFKNIIDLVLYINTAISYLTWNSSNVYVDAISVNSIFQHGISNKEYNEKTMFLLI